MTGPLTDTPRSGIALAAAALAVLLVAAGPVSAQEQAAPGSAAGTVPADTDADEALEQFRVELIVFEYGDSLAGTTEDWSAPPDPVEDTATVDGAETGTEADTEADTEAAETGETGETGIAGDPPEEPVFRFMPLPEEELELGELYRRLGNTDGYEPLLHVAWQQPGYDPETARSLDLSRLAELPDGLQGEARLYRSRFLHLELDLELWSEPQSALPAPQSATPTPLFPDRGRSDPGEPLEALAPDVYRLNERRKLRSGELHYYDHPRYGVLAKVTPVEMEEQAAGEPDSGEGEPADPTPTDASSATD
ncbi:CsiV family protein [Lentisalinibacter sediminis]|uniref:CsiV family protein n=1 Tax=Lentisalinibacter sediminis TaxID=2992237 RepID=UPI003869F124